MKTIRSAMLVLSVTLLVAPLFAADEYTDEIPIDLARALINYGGAGANTRIYKGLPDNFPDIKLPKKLKVLGSLNSGFTQRVILQNDGDLLDVIMELKTNLEAAGWQEIMQYRPPQLQQQRGFVMGTSLDIPRTWCNDAIGNMQVIIQPSDGKALFNLNINQLPRGATPGCQAMQQNATRNMNMDTLQKYMPTLQAPPTLSGPNGYQSRGGGGSGSDYQSRASITVKMTCAELFGHFADQVENQGRQADKAMKGEYQAAGSWTRQDDKGKTLIGMLSIVKMDDNNYEMTFRIVRQGEAPSRFTPSIGSFNSINQVL